MEHTWVFQLSAPLAESESQKIQEQLEAFLQEWDAHGTPVPASVNIPYQQFITIQAEEGSTSGCSIDKMTRTVRTIVESAGKQVMEPQNVFFRDGEGKISFVDFREIPGAIASGELTAETTIFDSSLGQTSDLNNWEVKLQDSWVARYLN